MGTVFSYIRFSSKPQELGDSMRRQTSMGDAWMKRHPQHVLDTSLSLQDLGTSAFRGKNLDRDKGDLGKFIALAKDGKVPAGSILLLENLDRFSRQAPRKAYRVFCELVEAGVTIQTLNPEQTIDERNIDDMATILPVVVAMQLAFEESRKKAERQVAAWAGKRQQAIKDGKPMTRRCCGWVSWDDRANEWRIKPGAKETIEYIFRRTTEGIGKQRLLGELQGKFKTFGKSQRWNSSMLSSLLEDRTVLGEFTPLRQYKDRAQQPIKDYYPRIISDDLFHRARAASIARRTVRGPCSGFVNLFTGRIFFKDGYAAHLQNIHRLTKTKGKLVFHRLYSAGHKDHVKGACELSLEYHKVERYILSLLFQIEPKDLLPGEQQDDMASKRQELAGVSARLSELESALTTTKQPIPALLTAISELSNKRDTIQQQIETLEGSKATRKAQPLKGIQTVLKAIEKAPEAERNSLRLKLRGLIASIVEKIELSPYRVESSKSVEAGIVVWYKDGIAKMGATDTSTREPTELEMKLMRESLRSI